MTWTDDEGRDHDRFTDYLRAQNEPAWSAATEHRFTEELLVGTVDDEVFARYLVQDYAFVETLADVIGYAAGQAPTLDAKETVAEFLLAVVTDEDDYFRRSFDALDVPESEWREPSLLDVTERFDDLLRAAAHEGGYAETLAVLVPVEWVYLSWASRAGDDRPDAFYLAEWVDLHVGPEFEATVAFLREELDVVAADLSPRRRARVERFFRRAVDLEVAFFDAAYDAEPK